RIWRGGRACMALHDMANGIEHVFATGAHTAIEQRAPFLTSEWFLAAGAGFADVTALRRNDSVAVAPTHDRCCEIAGNDYDRVLDTSLRMRRKHQLTMHRRIGIPIDRSIYVILCVVPQ